MRFKINWDTLGIAASVACAIHCAILPLLFTTLPLFGLNIIENRLFEIGMILLSVLIGFNAFYHSFKRHHHSYLPGSLFLIGLLFLVAKEILDRWEILLLIPAVLLIITSHLLNHAMCRRHNHAHTDDCNH